MRRTCRQCKKFNPWAVAMVIMDDAKACKADVWSVQEYMSIEELEDKLSKAAECEHFEPRTRG